MRIVFTMRASEYEVASWKAKAGKKPVRTWAREILNIVAVAKPKEKK